jgi:hypothetical protein
MRCSDVLIILRRKVRGGVHFTNGDRLFLVQLYRWFPSVLKTITNDLRTHRSFDKDAPFSRPVQRTGRIRMRSSADCITATCESEFSVHTTVRLVQVHDYLLIFDSFIFCERCPTCP